MKTRRATRKRSSKESNPTSRKADPVITPTDIYCTIGFNIDYAAAVHEILDRFHPNGEAKFLETAINAWSGELASYIADELKEGV